MYPFPPSLALPKHPSQQVPMCLMLSLWIWQWETTLNSPPLRLHHNATDLSTTQVPNIAIDEEGEMAESPTEMLELGQIQNSGRRQSDSLITALFKGHPNHEKRDEGEARRLQSPSAADSRFKRNVPGLFNSVAMAQARRRMGSDGI